MSNIEQIANLLRSQIEQRRTLAIGTAQSASIQGTRALYQTPSGIISAIATNFCYGDCLLAKVEGVWYAINPSDNREVVRSSVDQMIRSKISLNEVILPEVSIQFAPGSPTQLEPNAGDFVIRIKIDQPQENDLQVKCELSGTAANSDYFASGLDNDLIVIIPAGQDYANVIITPTQNSLNLPETVILKLLQDQEYEIGQDNLVTATILVPIPLQLSIEFAPNSPTQLKRGSGDFVARITANAVQSANLYVFFSLGGTADYGSNYTTSSSDIAVILPAGELFLDLLITPLTSDIYDPNHNTITLGLVAAWVGYTQYAFSNNTLTMTILPRQFVSTYCTRYTSVTFDLYTIYRPDLAAPAQPPGFPAYLMFQDIPTNIVKTPGAWSVETVSVDEGANNFIDYNSYWESNVAIDVYGIVADYNANVTTSPYFPFDIGLNLSVNLSVDASNGIIGFVSSVLPPTAPPRSLETIYADPPGYVSYTLSNNSIQRNYFSITRLWYFYPRLVNARIFNAPLQPETRNPSRNSVDIIYDAWRKWEYV